MKEGRRKERRNEGKKEGKKEGRKEYICIYFVYLYVLYIFIRLYRAVPKPAGNLPRTSPDHAEKQPTKKGRRAPSKQKHIPHGNQPTTNAPRQCARF